MLMVTGYWLLVIKQLLNCFTLLITRFAKTAPKEIEVSIDRLEQAGIETKGVILNAVEKTASSYYAYGYYNYSYKSE